MMSRMVSEWLVICYNGCK